MEKIDELLIRLDEIAREYNSYEYGLPIFDDEPKAIMRQAVQNFLDNNTKSIVCDNCLVSRKSGEKCGNCGSYNISSQRGSND